MAPSVASNLITSFWEGLGDNTRSAFNDAIPEPEQKLEKHLAAGGSEVNTIAGKHTVIKSIAEDELEVQKGSTEKAATREVTHLIAMVDSNGVAAWHRLLQNNDVSRPNLAALYNLAGAYSDAGKYLECEGQIRAMIPLLQQEISAADPRALGGIRMLADCIYKQGRKEEASDILDVARNLVLGLTDQELKDDEMNEVNKVSASIG